MKLSIVVPVYQVKSTLPRCLDSIIRQSFRDWQMILVDDASTDGSAQICDKYVRQERRIQVVHLKHNAGLSAARNAGIEKAKGDYITFIDSDDYIADDTLKLLMELLNIHPDYDILEYPVYEHFGSNQRHMLHFPGENIRTC
jgi:glycosyltransferase involved in cell wall biosynthesis